MRTIFLLSLFFLTLLRPLYAQRLTKSTLDNGDVFSFLVHHDRGDQAGPNILSLRLMSSGPQYENAIEAVYQRFHPRFRIAASANAYVADDGNRLGFVGLDGTFYLLRHNQKRVGHFDSDRLGTLRVGERAYWVRFPILVSQTIGLHLGAARTNQLGTTGVALGNSPYFIQELTTTDLAFGPTVNIIRHYKVSSEDEPDITYRKTFSLSITADAILFPAMRYSYSLDPQGNFPATFDPADPFPEEQLRQRRVAFRLELETRIMYLQGRNMGFSWKVGAIRSAFFPNVTANRYYYGGIGVFCGWGKTKVSIQENEKEVGLPF